MPVRSTKTQGGCELPIAKLKTKCFFSLQSHKIFAENSPSVSIVTKYSTCMTSKGCQYNHKPVGLIPVM